MDLYLIHSSITNIIFCITDLQEMQYAHKCKWNSALKVYRIILMSYHGELLFLFLFFSLQ